MMPKWKNVICASAVFFLWGILLTGIPLAQAESLWNETSSAANLFSDRKARAVGDIITIIINESSQASRTGNATNSKSSSADIKGGAGILRFNDIFSGGASDSFKTQGAVTNSNTVTARLTVKVTEIKPNGNLAVSGTQMIKQNKEEQKIIISGMVRPEDISADNTVLSSYVADAEIRIDGKGPLSDKQRQGILTQIFNFLY